MPDTRVAIVDSGGANIASLRNALDRLRADNVLTSNARAIRSASHVILPGVGTAADAMRRLKRNKLAKVIADLNQPVLGICLGMQLIARSSEEDSASCLAIIPAVAERLQQSPQAPVPNMGWCRVRQTEPHPLFRGIADNSYFYFAHSYSLAIGDDTIASADHTAPFTAVLAHRNFVGAQFHPERSADVGAKFLSNFLGLVS